MLITSKENPLIKKIIALKDKKFRRAYGEFIVESVKAVDEGIKSGAIITDLVCTCELSEKYTSATVVTDILFERISTEKTPQGVLAVVKIPQNHKMKPDGDCLLLDRLQDPGNLGTIIRTANAAGYEDLYLINCADPYSPKAVRASMGGIFYVRLHECTLSEALELFGGKLICADMDGEDVFGFVSPRNFCLCIGNEGQGVDERIIKNASHTVKIPMRPSCESLNAGVSAAIAMYALKNNK